MSSLLGTEDGDMPTAAALALELGDERRFLAEHRSPALVFDAPGVDPDESRFDTPPQPFRPRGAVSVTPPDGELGSGTDVLGAIELTATGLVSDALQPEAQIEWLEKSERNPFGAMITVGRSLNNDVILADPRISKVHAIFTQHEGHWVIADSHSSNGTFVDGQRLPSGEKRAVEDGSELRFGRDVRARLVLPGSLLELLRLFVLRRPFGR